MVDSYKADDASIDFRIVNRTPPHSLLQLHADPGKISQVISNLVSNAMKFTSPNGSLYVTLSVEDEQHDLEMGCSFDERGHCIPKLPSLGPISKLRSPKTYAESFSASQFLVITVVDSGIGISAVIRHGKANVVS